MLKIQSKAKSARGKREMQKKEPKLVEDPKMAMFMKGPHCSAAVLDLLKDLAKYKKPHAIMMNKQNDIKPFKDLSSLEFLAEKNNAALFVIGSHMKKRPHTLTIGRLFNKSVLDFVELMVTDYKLIEEFEEKQKCSSLGQKPVITFHGDGWSADPVRQMLKNLLIDLFNAEPIEKVALNGIDTVISAFMSVDGLLRLRVYAVELKKSDCNVPFVKLIETGPNADMKLGRSRNHDDETWHQATRIPANTAKKEKNVSTDILGATVGKIHVGRQDLTRLQTRKMKGLKRRRDTEEVENQDEAGQEENGSQDGAVASGDEQSVQTDME